MADMEYKMLFRIDTQESIKSVGDLKANIKNLKRAIDETEDAEKRQSLIKDLQTNQRALKLVMDGSTKSLYDAEKAANGLGDSYNALSSRLTALKKEHHATTDEFKRKELSQEINAVNDQLKDLDAQNGVFSRNVGNYKQSFLDAFSSMGDSAQKVINPIKNADTALKAMNANPIFFTIAVVVKVLDKVIQGLKSSEENMDAMTIALAPLNAGSRLFTNIMQSLGKAIGKVAGWLGKMAEKLGLVSEEMKIEQQLTKDQIALRDKERETKQKNADLDLEISKLRTKVAEKDKYSARERIAFLEEATKKEREMADNTIAIAREKYSLLKRESELAGNSTEDNEALADAYVELQQAEKAYFDRTRELAGQRVEALNMIKAENKALDEQVVALEKVKLAKTKTTDDDTDIDAFLEELQAEQDAETQILLDGIDDREMLEELHRQNTRQAEVEMAKWRTSNALDLAGGLATIFGNLANAMDSTNERQFKQQKGLQIAEATINTIAGAIGAFMGITKDTGGWGIAGAIAQATAVATAGFAQIAKIRKTQYQRGGGGNAPATGMQLASVNAPAVETTLPTTRQLTSASEEDRLNRMARPARAYIVESDLEGATKRMEAREDETSF